MSLSDTASASPASTAPAQTNSFYWTLRREFWEHRAIYIAPLAVAALILFGFTVSLLGLYARAKALAQLTEDEKAAAIVQPYHFAAAAIIFTALIVSVFYCLGALYNERRDRTILFWKSLPVSDLTTVLAKASIPIVILPLIYALIIMAMHVLMYLVNTAGRLAFGLSTAPLWTHVPLFQMEVVALYGFVTQALWYAPIFAWLLMVSAWAKRSPFLWAFLAPLAVGIVERIAFDTHYFGMLVTHRLFGGLEAAFAGSGVTTARGAVKIAGPKFPVIGLEQLDPVKFLGSPGLWFGLVIAALFLAAAIWLRRYREPI
jgi:ABC-2 type transport system permease protein